MNFKFGSLLVVLFAMMLFVGCERFNRPLGLEIKKCYFPYQYFFEPKTYCYVNQKDTSDKRFWEMQTKIVGGDTLFFTKIYHAPNELHEELVENIVETGAKLKKYTIYDINNGLCINTNEYEIIDNVVFNWCQRIGETITWTVEYPIDEGSYYTRFSKFRTLQRFDTARSTAVFNDYYRFTYPGLDVKGIYYKSEFHYMKDIGLIQYKIILSGGRINDYKLVDIKKSLFE